MTQEPPKTDIAVIGAGAAGYFAAIHAAEGGARVQLFEKSTKTLSKVKISGGGRCNVTHDCAYPTQLVKHYPRGGRSLKGPFSQFGTQDTWHWFEARGVNLKTEDDGRVFPTSDDSQTVIDCLETEAQSLGVRLELSRELQKIETLAQGDYLLHFRQGEAVHCRALVIATGGSPQQRGYAFLASLGIHLHPPIPSLFTFNVPDSPLKDLMGLSVPQGSVQVPGTKWRQEGPVLITHWGFSAPAVIKLSAWQALEFYERNYHFPILINWTAMGEEELREELSALKALNSRKKVLGNPQFGIPQRLWAALVMMAEVPKEKVYGELSKKELNRLVRFIATCPFEVRGKTTFKEEFVTAGGIDLREVDLKTFSLKKEPRIFVAGEVLNVDGVTGGFNFQHAWTSGYIAGKSAAKALNDYIKP